MNRLGIACIGTAIVLAQGAQAASTAGEIAPTGPLEAVVVTATRGPRPLQDGAGTPRAERPVVGREFGFNRYEHVRDFDFTAGDRYLAATEPIWRVVRPRREARSGHISHPPGWLPQAGKHREAARRTPDPGPVGRRALRILRDADRGGG